MKRPWLRVILGLTILLVGCGEAARWDVKGEFRVIKQDDSNIVCFPGELWFSDHFGSNNPKQSIYHVQCRTLDGSWMDIPVSAIKEIRLSR